MSYTRLLGGLTSLGVAASVLVIGAAPPAAADKEDHGRKHRPYPTSVIVKKVVKTPYSERYERGEGWEFSTTVTLPRSDGRWLKPSFGYIKKGEPSTMSTTTSKFGLAGFVWYAKGWSTSDPVVLKETVKDGYESTLYCWTKDHRKDTWDKGHTKKWPRILKRSSVKKLQRRSSGTIDVQTLGNGQWSLGKLWPGQTVGCLAKNTLTKLKLTKVVTDGTATPANFDLTATPVGADGPIYDHPGDHGTYEAIAGDITYQLGESGPSGYSPAGPWTCTNGVVVNGDAQIVVPKGTKTECTIANTRNLAQLKLVKQVEGANPDSWTLTAQAAAPENDRNISTPGGSGQFETVYADTEYTLGETGPGGYTPSDWTCLAENGEEDVLQNGPVNQGDKVTLAKGQKVTCTIVNTPEALGSLVISKEFNPQTSGFAGTFAIDYACVNGATPVTNGTVQLAAGQNQTITGLPTGTVCAVTEPTLPAPPAGWQFNPPTFTPGNNVTVTTPGQVVTVAVTNSIAQVSPEVVRRACPIKPDLNRPKPKRVGNRILLDKVKTRKSSCRLVKPVVLCRPIPASAAGEAAFCDTRSTKRGRVRVDTEGYEAVRVTVVVRAKAKAGFKDRWKAKTWRKSWVLR